MAHINTETAAKIQILTNDRQDNCKIFFQLSPSSSCEREHGGVENGRHVKKPQHSYDDDAVLEIDACIKKKHANSTKRREITQWWHIYLKSVP